ncbi:unnamed protein product [Zymoseptoria tritici ST99CH_1E4]|uniref:Enoyl-CoA hydratase n=1 Tax=Zymoseptoria tritici ST99CH_1E4 TaxID=1276532 RepID=A0A2H1GFP2_ZYMTR|nr:unnamed protein product [Zymoseptoria tritici ST99CH_1E4]
MNQNLGQQRPCQAEHLASAPCRATTTTRSSSNSTLPPVGISHTVTEPTPNNHIATITLSNPLKLNILTTPLLHALTSTLHSLSSHPTLRCLILTSSPTPQSKPPSFIGGADISEMHALTTPASAQTFIRNIHDTCAAIRTFPVPVIARIHGLCLGAGLELAASCDLRIASEISTFGMPEVAVGIPSVVEAALLPGLIGTGRTRRLVYLAERIDAEEAERWGLVERVVDGGEVELDAAVKEWTDRLGQMGPAAIRAQKKLCRGWEQAGGVEEAVEMGVEAYGRMWEDGGSEPREFMGRFVNRKRGQKGD